jgi:TolB-like protein
MDTLNPLRFGTFELDVHSRELRDGSTSVRLQGQPFEILCLMIEHRGTVVTREQLRRRLWPEGTFVDFEHSLNAAIKRLRSALGDDADQPKFVETVPRRGYRLLAAPLDPDVVPRPTRIAVSPRLRLAVLPFSNLSGDTSQEYFSDGVTEEVIAQLGRLCRGDMGIIARWSTMAYKGCVQRAREIGEALQAEYLLEGSTRHDRTRVRITARLVETASEADLWSETYDRTVSDWLSVQTDVAGDVAQSVVKELAPDVVATSADDPRHPRPYPGILEGVRRLGECVR